MTTKENKKIKRCFLILKTLSKKKFHIISG